MEPTILQYIGTALAMLIGLNGLFRPVIMGKAVGLKHSHLVGLVEIRVLFGSFMVVMPSYIIFLNKAEFFVVFGVAALAAAVIKSTFTIIDGCPLKYIWSGILVDVVLSVCLLSSFFM